MNISQEKKVFLAWAVSFTTAVLCGYYYLTIQRGFFDDAYIYLAMARNAIDHGTWQYYPGVVDRPALLASSPLRILVLTVAAGISKIIGFGDRALYDAKVTLLISGWVSWLAFAPFWRKRLHQYAIVGAILAILSLCLDTAFEFEGGLLFLWIITLVLELRSRQDEYVKIGQILPVGMLIRPDMALPIIALIIIKSAKTRSDLTTLLRAFAITSVAIILAWSAIALSFGTYPIPVTYWAKAAIPLLVEHKYFIQVLPERLGQTLTFNFSLSPIINSVIGWFTIALAAITSALFRPKFGASALIAFLAITIVILSRLPASFWWYYQNVICLFIGFGFGILLTNPSPSSLKIASITLGPGLLIILIIGRMPNRGPELWRTYIQSRAQGYLSIATLATGNGTIVLPNLGEVIVKNPEIGMTAYFSKRPYFQWDSAGLAQPLDDPKVLKSPLRFFYPKSLRTTANQDAQQITDRIGKKIPVVEAWAMEDRDYSKASRHCRYVFPQYALCVNTFLTLTPNLSRKEANK